MTAIHCQRIEAALRKAKPGTGERYQKLARLHWQSAALAATLETRLRLTHSSKLDKRTPTDGELQWPDKEKRPRRGRTEAKGAYRLSHAAWVARHGPGIGVWFFHPPVRMESIT